MLHKQTIHKHSCRVEGIECSKQPILDNVLMVLCLSVCGSKHSTRIHLATVFYLVT